MALVIDQESNFKHFCKICKKGFLCGRALGGHMRAHGIGDESVTIDDDDQASDWEDKLGDDDVPPSKKRMYALRTNPNRLKSCRVCENCGKEFSSWKSFLEHGKCSSEDAESLVSSPGSYGDIGIGRTTCGWSKRKRSFRAQVGHLNSNFSSTEEEDFAANCLMMLSNAATVDRNPTVAEPEESCASASKDEERRANPLNFISSLSCKIPTDHNKVKGVAKAGLFECKACKKVFNSHQALGGHRASHKKVKGCFAAKLDQIEDSLAEDDVITHEEFFPAKTNPALGHGSNAQLVSTSKRKSKVHECSICHRVFSSGQALGGHKRCHWITSNAPDTSTLARFQQLQEQLEHMNQTPKFDSETLDLRLDLNLPAPGDQELAGDRHKVTTEIYLQSWVEKKEADEEDYHHIDDDNNEDKTNKKNNNASLQNVDDEADSTVKLAKLSELKDMNLGGNSTAWLQVGIASTDGGN